MVVRHTKLLERVWDMQFDPESNVADVHMRNLRPKLTEAMGNHLIANVRGVGFSPCRESDFKAAWTP